jgi:predicted transposase YdaD
MQHNRKTRDLREVVMSLTPAYEKWEAEKIAEGEKRGEKRGEKLGKELGEKSGKKLGARDRSLQIAGRLLKKRMPIAEIAELTDLTIEQVQELQDR